MTLYLIRSQFAVSPAEAQAVWYGMRCWIECLFKDLKRGGLGWHHTKMTDPARAERLWLAIAVATKVGVIHELPLPWDEDDKIDRFIRCRI